jgi:hypothetical protein
MIKHHLVIATDFSRPLHRQMRASLSFACAFVFTLGIFLIAILGVTSTIWCMGCLRDAVAAATFLAAPET